MEGTSSEQGMLRANGSMRIQNACRSSVGCATGLSVSLLAMLAEVTMWTEAWCFDATFANRINEVKMSDELPSNSIIELICETRHHFLLTHSFVHQDYPHIGIRICVDEKRRCEVVCGNSLMSCTYLSAERCHQYIE